MLINTKLSTDNIKTHEVSAIDCLNKLNKEEKDELNKTRINIDFSKGETIIKRGFVASNILFIESGLVKLDILNDGVYRTVDLIPEGSFIGIICTFASKNINFSAVAIENTRISLIDSSVFERMIKQNSEFAFSLIQHMSQISNNIVHSISRFTHKNIDGSVAILLIKLYHIYKSESFTLPFNRIVMAEIIAYSKESVINCLSRFNKDNIIKLSGKNIHIVNLEKLTIIATCG